MGNDFILSKRCNSDESMRFYEKNIDYQQAQQSARNINKKQLALKVTQVCPKVDEYSKISNSKAKPIRHHLDDQELKNALNEELHIKTSISKNNHRSVSSNIQSEQLFSQDSEQNKAKIDYIASQQKYTILQSATDQEIGTERVNTQTESNEKGFYLSPKFYDQQQINNKENIIDYANQNQNNCFKKKSNSQSIAFEIKFDNNNNNNYNNQQCASKSQHVKQKSYDQQGIIMPCCTKKRRDPNKYLKKHNNQKKLPQYLTNVTSKIKEKIKYHRELNRFIKHDKLKEFQLQETSETQEIDEPYFNEKKYELQQREQQNKQYQMNQNQEYQQQQKQIQQQQQIIHYNQNEYVKNSNYSNVMQYPNNIENVDKYQTFSQQESINQYNTNNKLNNTKNSNLQQICNDSPYSNNSALEQYDQQKDYIQNNRGKQSFVKQNSDRKLIDKYSEIRETEMEQLESQHKLTNLDDEQCINSQRQNTNYDLSVNKSGLQDEKRDLSNDISKCQYNNNSFNLKNSLDENPYYKNYDTSCQFKNQKLIPNSDAHSQNILEIANSFLNSPLMQHLSTHDVLLEQQNDTNNQKAVLNPQIAKSNEGFIAINKKAINVTAFDTKTHLSQILQNNKLETSSRSPIQQYKVSKVINSKEALEDQQQLYLQSSCTSSNFSMFNPNDDIKGFFQKEFGLGQESSNKKNIIQSKIPLQSSSKDNSSLLSYNMNHLNFEQIGKHHGLDDKTSEIFPLSKRSDNTNLSGIITSQQQLNN